MSSTVHVDRDQQTGEGWVSFAAFMISIVAILNCIYGIAAISNSKFYFGSSTYIIPNLNVYGWVVLILGLVQFAAVFGIFTRTTWARWVGIATASVNAIIQVVWIATYPLASLAILTLDVLVIYGLIAHGHRRASLAL
jgi:hypothetical protein